ncbi:carbohydrate ABC transporter permease [Nonomuraea sp. CA-143628]|uniref:carbohydrate ABC transporter permease n=1 Tax=Nonomuraea sp. CA-143628 TaxID=3239997 RepID=UPI003D930BB3
MPQSTKLRKVTPYAFIALPLAYMTVIIIGPAVAEIWTSFTDSTTADPTSGTFIGLGNYRDIIGSGELLRTLITTVCFMLGTVALTVLLGTTAAVLLDRPFRGRGAARSILTFGWAVPPVATALGWSWLYNQQSGVLNEILGLLGLPSQAWLTSEDSALFSVIAAVVWQFSPFVMLVVLATLQSVPEEVVEAARIDKADALNVFRAVTLPHIKPAIRLAALLIGIWSMRMFELIFLLTGGGPLNSTSTLVVSLQQAAFRDYSLGKAAAFGVIGLMLSLLVAAVYQYFEKREARGAAQ